MGLVKITREIKACPFCGENKEIKIEGIDGLYFIRCGGCGAGTTSRITEDRAIDSWNRRVCAPEAPVVDHKISRALDAGLEEIKKLVDMASERRMAITVVRGPETRRISIRPITRAVEAVDEQQE